MQSSEGRPSSRSKVLALSSHIELGRPDSGKILEGIFPSTGLKNRALWAPIFYPVRCGWLAGTFGFMFVRVPLRALHSSTRTAPRYSILVFKRARALARQPLFSTGTDKPVPIFVSDVFKCSFRIVVSTRFTSSSRFLADRIVAPAPQVMTWTTRSLVATVTW